MRSRGMSLLLAAVAVGVILPGSSGPARAGAGEAGQAGKGQARKGQAGAGKAPQAAPGSAAQKAPADAPAVARALAAADRQLKRRRWKQAEAAYRKVLAQDGDHPAARYGLAVALIHQKKTAEAIAALQELGRSSRPDAPPWRVEARLGKHFESLRADPAFRRAVGIDPDPARPPTAYERLVGQGGTWEQAGMPCQEPQVTLSLDRKKKKFSLVIRTRCQGMDDRTRLGGTWAAAGTDRLALTFPNQGGPDERLECSLAPDGGEDALTCALEDLSFTMRVVRR